MASPYRRAGHHGRARITLSSFQFWVFPIPASRPMPSGFFMCMALPPTEDTRPEVHRSNGRRASQAGRGSPNGYQPEPVKKSWSVSLAQTPSGHARGSTEPNAGARQTLRTVWSGGQVCAKPYKSLHMWHIESRRENEPSNGARQTLHTVSFWAQRIAAWNPALLVETQKTSHDAHTNECHDMQISKNI